MKASAQQIIKALKQRHRDDVVFSEMTMGAAGGRRLDFWALKKSWSPVNAIGYEVKVSRADFLNDDKWPAYLGCCHQFYFACPWKLIMPDELPKEVGLMWMTQTGSMQIKKKAQRKAPDANDFQNALIRAAWGKYSDTQPRSRLEVAEMHRQRVEAAEIGRHTAQMLGRKNSESFRRLSKKSDDAVRLASSLEYVHEWTKEKGIDLSKPLKSTWGGRQTVKGQLDQLFGSISKDTLADIDKLRNQLSLLIEKANENTT